MTPPPTRKGRKRPYWSVDWNFVPVGEGGVEVVLRRVTDPRGWPGVGGGSPGVARRSARASPHGDGWTRGGGRGGLQRLDAVPGAVPSVPPQATPPDGAGQGEVPGREKDQGSPRAKRRKYKGQAVLLLASQVPHPAAFSGLAPPCRLRPRLPPQPPSGPAPRPTRFGATSAAPRLGQPPGRRGSGKGRSEALVSRGRDKASRGRHDRRVGRLSLSWGSRNSHPPQLR
jgi:hypothetical protein